MASMSERRLDEKLLALAKPKLLIVDETRLSAAGAGRGASVLPAGQPPLRTRCHADHVESQRCRMGHRVRRSAVATAILDRLLHHSHALKIRGDGYRLRAKRKSGLIKALPAGDGPPVGSASLRPVTSGNNHQTTS
jgi:hypothetical protein